MICKLNFQTQYSLPLDVSGVLVVAAECSLLTLGGHWHHNGGGRAETLHGGREADARAVDDLGPGRPCRRSLGSLSRLAGLPAGRSSDTAAATAGTDGRPVYLVTQQGEEPSHAGALATLVQGDLLSVFGLGRLLLLLHLKVG